MHIYLFNITLDKREINKPTDVKLTKKRSRDIEIGPTIIDPPIRITLMSLCFLLQLGR